LGTGRAGKADKSSINCVLYYSDRKAHSQDKVGQMICAGVEAEAEPAVEAETGADIVLTMFKATESRL